jgi:mannose-6-phosphate isomerase-like protein (cupin superfamily)
MRSYPGNLVTSLVSSGETENRFCLFEAQMQTGNEPPLHLHEDRDVVLYISEGEMDVYCGTEVRRVSTGDAVFLPRLLPFTYRVLSPIVRFLAEYQPGNGVEGFFEGLSEPVSSTEYPTGATASHRPDLASILAVAAQHGIKFLTPAETAELLPHANKPSRA